MQPTHPQYAKLRNTLLAAHPQLPPYQTNEDNHFYYTQRNKVYYIAYLMKAEAQEMDRFWTELRERVQAVQRSLGEVRRGGSQGDEDQRPKRFRRTNQMIDKPFKCSEPKCDKIYASEGSLQQHIKLKHESPKPRHKDSQNNPNSQKCQYENSQSESSHRYHQQQQQHQHEQQQQQKKSQKAPHHKKQ